MSNVEQLPVTQKTDRPAPKRVIRPCEWGLLNTVRDLEIQMGTVEAYNRLCDAAQKLKDKIDAGDAEQQSRLFATDPAWIYPAGAKP